MIRWSNLTTQTVTSHRVIQLKALQRILTLSLQKEKETICPLLRYKLDNVVFYALLVTSDDTTSYHEVMQDRDSGGLMAAMREEIEGL